MSGWNYYLFLTIFILSNFFFLYVLSSLPEETSSKKTRKRSRLLQMLYLRTQPSFDPTKAQFWSTIRFDHCHSSDTQANVMSILQFDMSCIWADSFHGKRWINQILIILKWFEMTKWIGIISIFQPIAIEQIESQGEANAANNFHIETSQSPLFKYYS